jgi:hypothetical protein
MLEFTVRADDSEHSMRRLLEAHRAYEHSRTARSVAVHGLALVSVVVWLGACWPGLLAADTQTCANQLWGVVFFAVLVTGVREWQWYRRLRRAMAERRDAKLH